VERKNKASLFPKIRFEERKGRFSEKPQAWTCYFFLGTYLCEQDEKGFLKIKGRYSHRILPLIQNIEDIV